MKRITVILFSILFILFFIFYLQIQGVIVLPASPERCTKLRSVLSDEQISSEQDYWDKRCGRYYEHYN